MLFLMGLLVAALSLLLAILHLQQSVSYYIDFVGLITVFGGTLAVTIITLPWGQWPELKRGFLSLVKPAPGTPSGILFECLEFVRQPQAYRGQQEILRDGAELISLGIATESLHAILEERIQQSAERQARVANSIRSLAKYPPAFGLSGTVLGLVSLMRAVADGGGAGETGLRMAVALTATFYGLLLANLVINPAGELVLKTATELKSRNELALQAVVLAAERTSLLEAQEMLNSYVHPSQRINILDGLLAAQEGAA